MSARDRDIEDLTVVVIVGTSPTSAHLDELELKVTEEAAAREAELSEVIGIERASRSDRRARMDQWRRNQQRHTA